MADLGFLHFYFSCKNYPELAQARITKLLGFFTTNPKKLSLHFFQIFYDFLRNLQESAKWLYYLRCGFAAGSLELSDTSQICP
jgi:hypothetical protein